MTSPTSEELLERYGKPQSVDRGAALRILGLRGTIHPDDVVAFLYPSQEECDAFAAGNLEHWGHPDLGSCVTDAGIIGVTDLRHCLPVVHDPALPDHPASAHIPGARPPRY